MNSAQQHILPLAKEQEALGDGVLIHRIIQATTRELERLWQEWDANGPSTTIIFYHTEQEGEFARHRVIEKYGEDAEAALSYIFPVSTQGTRAWKTRVCMALHETWGALAEGERTMANIKKDALEKARNPSGSSEDEASPIVVAQLDDGAPETGAVLIGEVVVMRKPAFKEMVIRFVAHPPDLPVLVALRSEEDLNYMVAAIMKYVPKELVTKFNQIFRTVFCSDDKQREMLLVGIKRAFDTLPPESRTVAALVALGKTMGEAIMRQQSK